MMSYVGYMKGSLDYMNAMFLPFQEKRQPMPFEKWPKEIWMEHAGIVDAIAEGNAAEA